MSFVFIGDVMMLLCYIPANYFGRYLADKVQLWYKYFNPCRQTAIGWE